MTNPRNLTLVNRLKDRLTPSVGVVLTRYQGLQTPELLELRQKLAQSGSAYTVVRNTLLKIACQGNASLEKLTQDLTGPIAILTSSTGNLLQALKDLVAYSRDHPQLEVIAGWVDQQLLDTEHLKVLAELPTRTELSYQLLRVITSNQRRLVAGLSYHQSRLVTALANLSSKRVNSRVSLKKAG